MRWMLRFAVVMLVCAPVTLAAPQSAASAGPAITITPDTGLVGGDVVTLAGTGFEPNSTVYYCQGNLAGPFSAASCGNADGNGNTFVPPSVMADGNGAFSVPVTVFRFITPSSGLMDCAQPGATCGIGAANFPSLIGDRAPITFTAQPPATFAVKGSVVAALSGNPVPNVAVWAYAPSSSWVGSFQTVTNASGDYQLDISTSVNAVRFGPPAGTDLTTQWYDNQTHRYAADRVFPLEFDDPVITLATQHLVAGGAITGVVTDSTGAAVANVTVSAYGPGDTWVASFGTHTAADGSYRIAGVRPADYKVRFVPPSTSGLAIQWYDNVALRADANSVTVTAGATTTGIDDQLGASS